jgi:hypothetical protein
MAKTDGRARQILIEETGDGLATLTERQLVEKSNMAIELMGTEEPELEGGGKVFIAAQKLQRGRILYVTRSAEAAETIRKPNVKEKFMAKFCGTAHIKDRGFSLVEEFVLTHFSPDRPDSIKAVEADNGMDTGQVISAKYIKEASKRKPVQQTDFVLMEIKTANAANRILREGIVIEGKRVFAKNNTAEVRRGMKCQGYQGGHISRECKSIHDVYARCAGMHRTNECDAPPEATRCVNCRQDGQSASDRTCTIFKAECAKRAGRNPEKKNRYFKTAEDPTSWERLEDFEMPAANTGTLGRRDEYQRPRMEEARPWTDPRWEEYEGWDGAMPTGGPSRRSMTKGGRNRGFLPPAQDQGRTKRPNTNARADATSQTNSRRAPEPTPRPTPAPETSHAQTPSLALTDQHSQQQQSSPKHPCGEQTRHPLIVLQGNEQASEPSLLTPCLMQRKDKDDSSRSGRKILEIPLSTNFTW